MKDPLEQLPIGTNIRVGEFFGTIESVKVVPAVPSGMIAVHTVRLTQRRVRSFGNVYKKVDLPKPRVHTVNYSMLEVGE